MLYYVVVSVLRAACRKNIVDTNVMLERQSGRAQNAESYFALVACCLDYGHGKHWHPFALDRITGDGHTPGAF